MTIIGKIQHKDGGWILKADIRNMLIPKEDCSKEVTLSLKTDDGVVMRLVFSSLEWVQFMHDCVMNMQRG